VFTPDSTSLIEAERARRKAIVADDFDTLEAMTADYFHYAHINGLVESYDTYFGRLRSHDPATRISGTSSSDLEVELRGGYALLKGQSCIIATAGEFRTLFLSVWEPDESGWKIVAYASTPLPDAN